MKGDGMTITMVIIVHDTTEEVLARMSRRSPSLTSMKLYDFQESFPKGLFYKRQTIQQQINGWHIRREAHLKKQVKKIKDFMKAQKCQMAY